MTHPDITAEIAARMPDLRGRLLANQLLAPFTWLRVGGPAQVLFTPADTADLAYFLKHLPADIPVMAIGLVLELLTPRSLFRCGLAGLFSGFTRRFLLAR